MRRYCKAYHLRDLRQFSLWQEQPHAYQPPLTDESIVYLWDDFTVAASPIQHDPIIFAMVTPEWQRFCTNTLHFTIPEDLRFAYQSASPGDAL
jgi:hypothetical protein